MAPEEEHEGASAKELLIEACRRNNTDLLTETLAGKTDDQIADLLNGTTTVMGNHLYHEAASRGNYEIIDLLLDQPFFECDPLDRLNGDTPLHTAIRFLNNQEQQPPSSSSSSPSSSTSHEFGLALIDMMLEAGSNPRVKNKGGLTPLQLVDPRNTELRRLIERHEYALQNAGDFVTLDVQTAGRNAEQGQDEVDDGDDDAEFSGSDEEERAEWELRRRGNKGL